MTCKDHIIAISYGLLGSAFLTGMFIIKALIAYPPFKEWDKGHTSVFMIFVAAITVFLIGFIITQTYIYGYNIDQKQSEKGKT